MLRILLVWRPNALRLVPACTALRRKLATGNFSVFADPLGFDSDNKNKKSIQKDELFGRGGRSRTLFDGFGDHC